MDAQSPGIDKRPEPTLLSIAALLPLPERADWWPAERWPLWALVLYLPVVGVIVLVQGLPAALMAAPQDEALVRAVLVPVACLAGLAVVTSRFWPAFWRFLGVTHPRRILQSWRVVGNCLAGLCLVMAVCVATVRIGFGPPEAGEQVQTVSDAPTHLQLLFASVFEEFLFRGLLLGVLVSHVAPRTAVIVSALLFWSMHVPQYLPHMEDIVTFEAALVYTVPALLLGVVAGWYQLRWGNILACILFHYGLNLTSFALTRFW